MVKVNELNQRDVISYHEMLSLIMPPKLVVIIQGFIFLHIICAHYSRSDTNNKLNSVGSMFIKL